MDASAVRRTRWTWPVLIAAVVVLAILAYLGARKAASAEAVQPIAFDHQVMVGAGVTCLFCHSDATRSPVAGIPSVARCMGCHDVVDPSSPKLAELRDYWNRQQTIPWVRLDRLPRFVHFSHEVHVVAGALNCEDCHGDVGHMTVTQPISRLEMGWCLDCHEKQPNADQLKDCVVCHQ